MTFDRSSMLSAASLEFKAHQASPCPDAFYEGPRTLLKGTKRAGNGGTFCRTALNRSLASPLQCPEAFYEPTIGVGDGIPGSHGVVQKAKRWIELEDENSPGPIYIANIDAVRPRCRAAPFTKANRFPAPRPQYIPKTSSGSLQRSLSPIHSFHGLGSSFATAGGGGAFSLQGGTSTVAGEPRCTFGRRLPERSTQLDRERSHSPTTTTKAAATSPSAGTQQHTAGAHHTPSIPFTDFDTILSATKRRPSDTDAHPNYDTELETQGKSGPSRGQSNSGGSGRPAKTLKPKTKAVEVTPGPGHFLSAVFKSEASKWTMGRRFRNRESSTPGPGAYNITKAFRSGKPRAETFSRSGRSPLALGSRGVDSPGPALYSRLRGVDDSADGFISIE